MGGDYAPAEALKGVKQFLETAAPDVQVVLIGDQEKIAPLLKTENLPAEKYDVVHASQVIGMHEHPTKALKEKPDASINVGFRLLQREDIHAFVSAGNTGAMMVGIHYSIKTIEGIQRPTISTLMPRQEKDIPAVLLDVGINSDCKPEHLLQFAILGSLYSKHILHNPDPTVALLNMGEEEGKGTKLAQAAFYLMKENSKINFIGNMEGRDIFTDKADVVVCDGFTGNIVLKLAESVYDIKQKRQIEDEYLSLFNFENYGGTPVLGVAEPVVIGHGISRATAFKNMIDVAQQIIRSKLLDKIREKFAP